MLEFVIEGFLMRYDMSGYDIKQTIDGIKYYNASYGSIYPTLKKMEAEGLISSKEIIEAGKYKKIYSINEAGKSRFLEWLQKPPEILKSDNEHLVKLSFYEFLTKDKLKELIPALIRKIHNLARRYEVMASVLEKDMDVYQLATLKFNVDYYRFMKEWYSKFLIQLK